LHQLGYEVELNQSPAPGNRSKPARNRPPPTTAVYLSRHGLPSPPVSPHHYFHVRQDSRGPAHHS
jgi:hypothetical protein